MCAVINILYSVLAVFGQENNIRKNPRINRVVKGQHKILKKAVYHKYIYGTWNVTVS